MVSILLAGLMLPVSLARGRDYDDGYVERTVQPYRITGKVGSPDLFGLELEWIVPGVGDWLGARVSGSYLPIGNDQSEENGVVVEKDHGGLNHFGVGADLYFLGKGSGLFASAAYDRVAAWITVTQTQTDKKSYVNPTHLASLELGYRYVGTHITYCFMGGYGYNFAYKKVDPAIEDDPLIKKGNWILAGFSLGVALPFVRY